MREIKATKHFYDVFPFLTFFRIMEDENRLIENKVSTEDWEIIKTKWVMTHEDLSTDSLFRSKKDELKNRSRYNKLLFLKQRSLMSQDGLEEIYKSINLKWHKNPNERTKYLEQQILKAKRIHEIFEGQKQQLESEKIKEFNEGDNKKFGIEEAYECIASLELAGASIPEYEKLTLGKYDALNEVIKRRNSKNG